MSGWMNDGPNLSGKKYLALIKLIGDTICTLSYENLRRDALASPSSLLDHRYTALNKNCSK